MSCIVDGVPPRSPFDESEFQRHRVRRSPGQSKFSSQRREPEEVKILSGVFEGLTTGAPISLLIENVDQRSRDYGDIKDKFRPGHADYTYWKKYGIRDRSEEHTSELQSLMRISYAVFCLKKKKRTQ